MDPKNKRKTYLTIAFVAIATVATAGVISVATGVIPTPQTAKSAEENIQLIDFYIDVPDYPEHRIPIKKGEPKVIALDIYGSMENPLKGRIGVVDPDEVATFHATGEGKLPEDIAATLNKNIIDLPSQAEKGIGKRDTVQLNLSAAMGAKQGTYTVAVTLIDEPVNGIGRIYTTSLHLDVQE